jgi:hypothetical protein
MTQEEWRSSAWRGLDDLAREGLAGPDGMARALVTVAMLMKLAPQTVYRRYAYADAGRFGQAVAAAKARLVNDDHAIPRDSETVETLILALAAQLNALDALRHELDGDLAPADPSEDWRVAYADGEAFLIPRGGLHRPSRRDEGRAGKVTLSWRDLMPHHRLLPTQLGGVAIELHWRDMAGSWPSDAVLAAGLFTDLEFFEDLPGEDFVVTRVACADQAEQVKARLEAAHEAQGAVLILPELTMPTDQVDGLQAHLRQRLDWAEAKGFSAPGLVVAGSWHTVVDDQGRRSNLAPVFDAYGELILRHAKLLAFNAQGIPERIVPGDRLHVLVTEERLIGFGICLDFCERLEGAFFPALDIDYALITSCGEDRTMQGHIATARDMVIRFRSRAFVVQQRYPPFDPPGTDQPIGYVLPPRDDPALDAQNTLVRAPFTTHTTD